MPLPTLALVLTAARRSRNVRQGDLARAANMDASYLAALETGRRRTPSKRILDRLFQKLDATDHERRQLYELGAIEECTNNLRRYPQVPKLETLRSVIDGWPNIDGAEARTVAEVVAALVRRKKERIEETTK